MGTAVKTIQALTRPGLTWLFAIALVSGVLGRVELGRLELLWVPNLICLSIWFGGRSLPALSEVLAARRGKPSA